MVSFWRAPVWLILLIGGLVSAGCNIFDVSTAGPKTLDALVADAQTALAAGNASRAAHLLERAFEKDSMDVRVRIELGNALYRERGLDIFALREAAEHLVASSDPSSASSAAHSSRGAEVCTDGTQPNTASGRYAHIPMDAGPLQRLADRASVVERVRDLVVRGVLDRRSRFFSAASVRLRRKGLLVAAVTGVADEVVAIHKIFGRPERTLFLDRGAGSERVLVSCAENEDTLARTHDALCALSDATGRGIQWLQARRRLSGEGEVDDVFIERLRDVADAARARTDCS